MPKNNKIFIYIHSLSIGGGAENVCVRVAEAYVHFGFEVVVCSLNDEYPSFEERLSEKGVRILRLAGKFWELPSILKTEKPQVLSCWLYPCIITGIIAGRLAHVPEIITNLRGPDLKKNVLKVIIDRYVHYLSTGVLAVSDGVADVFMQREKYSAKKMTVIPNGHEYPAQLPYVDKAAARKALKLPKNAFLIGCLGRLYTEKNQRFVLEVLPQVLKKVPQAQLVLVGDGPEKDLLQKLAKQLKLGKKVIFAGWQKEVYGYLQAMDVCVLPSRYEGHPGAVLQAWYAKTPMLGSKVNGIRNLVIDGKNGLLFSLKEPEQLSNLLINVAQHPEYMPAMVADGYRQATTKYTLQKMLDAHVQYMRQRCLSYKVLTSWAELGCLSEEWDALNTQYAFQSFANTWYWHTQFAPQKQLAVVVVRDIKGIVAIAPFYRQGSSVGWLGEGRMNYLNVLGEPYGIIGFLKVQGVTGFALTNVRDDSALAIALKNVAAVKTRPCPYVAIDKQLPWDKYLASVLKNKRRYEIRTGEEALLAKGNVQLLTRHGGEVTDVEFAAIQALYMKRWSGSYRARYLQKEKKYFDYQRHLMRSPDAYISLLYVGDILVSFMFGFIKNKAFVDYWVAHDSNYADCSVGNVHVGMVMKDMHARGVILFDFSIGEEVYKRKWAKEDVLVKDFYFGYGVQYWKKYFFESLKEKIRMLIKN